MEGKDLVRPGEASSIQLPEETAGSEIVGSPSRESVDGKWCFSDFSPCESVPYDGEAISVESHPVDTEHIFSCLWFRDKLSSVCVYAYFGKDRGT